ncbi:MAG: serine/threonine-protein kinase [Planctomycetota bacterium]
MSRTPKGLSMWESVSRSAETLAPAPPAGDMGLLQDGLLPAPVLAALEARYELGRELGRGMSGVVLLARDRERGDAVALKVLRPSASRQQRERFAREAQLAARFDHPGIVRLLSSGDAAGAPYLAYELVPGARSLAAVIPERDRADRAGLVLELARIVGDAHAQGVVHRDLKPANVLVAQNGSLRLTDFGLGSEPDAETLTQTGIMIGTPLFMSPEQIRGKHSAFGPPCDVWALGVLLYACLVDALPFTGEDMLTLSARICGGERPRLHELDPQVDRRLEAVVDRALQPDPAARHPDARAFAEDLERALRAPASRGLPWPALAFGGLALLGLPLLAVWALAPPGASPTEPPPAIAEPPPAPPPPTLPAGAQLALPVGWTRTLEVELERHRESELVNDLSVSDRRSWVRMEWTVTGHQGRLAQIEATFEDLTFDYEPDSRGGRRGGLDPVHFDSRAQRDLDHPLLRLPGQRFSLELDLTTGQVERVRGIEAIHDAVYADVRGTDLLRLRLGWLGSSDTVRRFLNDLLSVLPPTQDAREDWSVSRFRTEDESENPWARGLPSVELEQLVGRCARAAEDRDLRLRWSAKARASSDRTPWTRPHDKRAFEVTADGELTQEGDFVAIGGEPSSASLREVFVHTRTFYDPGEDTPLHSSTRTTRVRISLRIVPR